MNHPDDFFKDLRERELLCHPQKLEVDPVWILTFSSDFIWPEGFS